MFLVCTAQLDNIENTMNAINDEMHKAEKELENLEKCCGLCVLPWNRSVNHHRPTHNPPLPSPQCWN